MFFFPDHFQFESIEYQEDGVTVDIQIPPEKVFWVCVWGPNTCSGGI